MTAPQATDEALRYWPHAETEERREVVRQLLADRHDPVTVGPAIRGDEPYDRALWRSLTADLGAAAVLAPEPQGGLGLGYEDYAMVAAELGRVLYSGPFFGSAVLSLGALLSVGDTELAARVAGGRTVAALAFADPAGRWVPDQPGVTARHGPDGWELAGRRHLVVDAPRADVFCVVADTGLFAVDGADAVVEPVESIDPTRPLGTVAFDHTSARQLADGDAAVTAVEAAVWSGRLAVAAECVGGAEAALRLTIEYVLGRRQFGKPIGAFQAVKHRCAEALIAVQAAKAAVSYATWALDDRSSEADLAVLAAKIAATEAFGKAAADGIQLHGTQGYTREAASQSYFRRARWLSLCLGSVDDDRQLLADRLGV